MSKRVVISGLAGALVLVVWTFVLNGVLGFHARLNMRQVPNERAVYEVLKSTIKEPGRYLLNPALTPDGRFPENEPVFGVHYGGVGHEAAGVGVLLGLAQYLVGPMLGTWMLSKASRSFRSRFANRASFFVAIGVLVAMASDVGSFGIGGSPWPVALLSAAATVVTWAIVGLAVALSWREVSLPTPNAT
jgi:hypothetical protein